MKRFAISLVSCFVFLGLVAGTGMADNLKIENCSPNACLPGGIQTSNGITGFDITNTGNTGSGSLYLAILEPNGPTTPGFTVNGLTPDNGVNFMSGTLWEALGENGGSDANYQPYNSFAQSALGTNQNVDFTAYDVLIGSYTSRMVVPINLSVSLPTGTIFVGFLENSDDNVYNHTPNSESLMEVGSAAPSPEPAVLLLFATGLIGVGVAGRRRSWA